MLSRARSQRAVQINIEIMRSFVRLREMARIYRSDRHPSNLAGLRATRWASAVNGDGPW